ncbi:copper resistance CopC family protein [Microbacterium sp. As-52]|uniref:copper resistance CopC family protein n=1 Tax=Microbacterium sp. As-52 TaxID=3390503 RepID=UPI003CF6E798
MTSVSTRIRRVSGAVCAAAVAIVLLTATPASAHDNLTDAVPSAGETVTNLDTVALTFSGELIDFSQTSFAQVQGPDGLFYESSCSTIELNVLTTPVALGASGTYTVLWNAVSSDGHPISESYQFDYAADPTATVALGWDAPACGNEGTRTQPGAALTSTPMPTDATNSAAPTQDTDREPRADGADESVVALAVVGGVVVLGVLAMATVLVVHRRRKRGE